MTQCFIRETPYETRVSFVKRDKRRAIPPAAYRVIYETRHLCNFVAHAAQPQTGFCIIYATTFDDTLLHTWNVSSVHRRIIGATTGDGTLYHTCNVSSAALCIICATTANGKLLHLWNAGNFSPWFIIGRAEHAMRPITNAPVCVYARTYRRATVRVR